VLSVKCAWQIGVGGLTCRWDEATELQSPYCPPWMKDTSTAALNEELVSPLVLALDFTRLSPFAGKGWFERMLEGFVDLPTRPPDQRCVETGL
jgi:hypothetical protein